MGRDLSAGIAWLSIALGATGWFVASTALLSRVPGALMLALALLGPAAYVAVAGTGKEPRPQGRGLLIAAAGGVLAFWASPALVLSQRASDAPSGTETLLFSLVASGMLVVIGAALAYRPRPGIAAIAACIAGVAGAASLLANWERPSSFSPLVRWPSRELLMLLAAALFAAGVLLLARFVRRSLAARRTAVLAAMGVAAAAAVPSLLGGGIRTLAPSDIVLLTVPYGLLVVGWLGTVGRLEPHRAASALIVPPVLMTSLILVERAVGVRGADPIVWEGAAAGIAVCVAGAAALLGSARPEVSDTEALAPRRPLVWAGWFAAAVSVATLALPAVSQMARGAVSSKEAFRAEWTVPGFQSAAGWVAAAAGLCALAVAVEVSRRAPVRRWVLVAVAGVVCAVAMPFLGDSTFATWNSWVPGDIQHAYGTEYAQLTIDAVSHPVRIASAAFSVLVIAVSAVVGASSSGRPNGSEGR